MAGDMAQSEKESTIKHEDLSLIPRTQMMEGETEFKQVVLWPSYVCMYTCPPPHTHN